MSAPGSSLSTWSGRRSESCKTPSCDASNNFAASVANGGDSLGDSWKGGSEPFDDSSWLDGTSGIGYEAGSGYTPLIGLNLIRKSLTG